MHQQESTGMHLLRLKALEWSINTYYGNRLQSMSTKDNSPYYSLNRPLDESQQAASSVMVLTDRFSGRGRDGGELPLTENGFYVGIREK
eukprot:scaffold15487_cov112-Skeletonema_marinoi.AAC.3